MISCQACFSLSGDKEFNNSDAHSEDHIHPSTGEMSLPWRQGADQARDESTH